ncbi:MAG: formylmethanofuran dehydrogenase [Deltaproteobacteria bacterium]|nr:formylmethanofuran dehydrogenase [Deltaproteobacteria bacterium]
MNSYLQRREHSAAEGYSYQERGIGRQDRQVFISLGPGVGSIHEKDLQLLVSFHGYLTAGAFVGLQMLFLGRRLLAVEDNERIHVQCETANCLPDPFQIIGGSTIGNKGLIIRDTGKLAVTITRHTPPGEKACGVRLILDPKKTKAFPKLHAWYLNTEKVPHEVVVPILKEAGEKVYSYTFVPVPVFGKKHKKVAICTRCGEPFVKRVPNDRRCIDCVD